MATKAVYIPNCYVCNKCGSRMDAIITPPLSILGKIKLVCNNCNKHMTKTWQERRSTIFLTYKICLGKKAVHKKFKQFISDIIDQTREETIREVLNKMRDVEN